MIVRRLAYLMVVSMFVGLVDVWRVGTWEWLFIDYAYYCASLGCLGHENLKEQFM